MGKHIKLSNVPALLKQWHPTRNENLKPSEIFISSKKKIWWKCPQGDDHEWRTTPNARYYQKTGCPMCSGRSAHKNNNLHETHPELIKEWHPSKNKGLSPKMLVPGSHKKVWWVCSKNKDHEWQTEIRYRTGNKGRKTGCPYCTRNISEPEVRLFSELKYLFEDALPSFRLKQFEIDVYIPSLKIGIEYDGYHYHKDHFKKDQTKNLFFKKKKIILFRVRELPLKRLTQTDIFIQKGEITKKLLNELLDVIKQKIKDKKLISKIESYKKEKKFINNSLYREYLSYLPGPLPEKSLNFKMPEVAKFWFYEKNFPLNPDDVSYSSNKKVWWKCPKGDDHKWEETINNRVHGKYGCPFCSGRRVSKMNNLLFKHPNLSKEWHPTKNGKLKPSDLTSGSKVVVWWKCPKGDDHEWKTSICNRTRTGIGTNCPFCVGKKVSYTNSLQDRYPKISKEWHPTKNGKLKPSDFTKSSGKKVWWMCSKDTDHEWEAIIYDRTRKYGTGCPICKRGF